MKKYIKGEKQRFIIEEGIEITGYRSCKSIGFLRLYCQPFRNSSGKVKINTSIIKSTIASENKFFVNKPAIPPKNG